MVATKVELSGLVRQPGLILAVPAPGQLCLAGARRRRDDRLWAVGGGTEYSVCLVRGHGTISPWAARIRVDAFFVPSLLVRRRRA